MLAGACNAYVEPAQVRLTTIVTQKRNDRAVKLSRMKGHEGGGNVSVEGPEGHAEARSLS